MIEMSSPETAGMWTLSRDEIEEEIKGKEPSTGKT
jgi:hypothetical protein